MPDKKCPRCGLWNMSLATRCDCGYDFEKATVEESYNQAELSRSARRDAQNALIAAIAGVFIFGIVLEPAAIYLARKAKKALAPGEEGHNNARTAETIACVGFVLWIFLCSFQAILIYINSMSA